MNNWEIIGTILSIVGVILTAQKNILAWYVNIFASAFYGIVFYQANLFADAELQVFFILSALYGLFKWRAESGASTGSATLHSTGSATNFIKTEGLQFQIAPSNSGGINNLIWGLFFVSIGAILLGYFHHYFFANASLPYLDATLTSASIWATILAAHKNTANWIVWIIVDTIYVGMYFYKGLYLTAGLYALFVVLAVVGFNKWKVKSEK